MRALALTLAALLVSGCFVFDELDNAEKTMGELSGKRPAAEKAEPEPAQGEKAPGVLARLQAWWTSQGQRAPKDDGPERNPDDVPVRCDVDGRSVFTHKFDCLQRGGKPV
jgi:hypothetical protein